MLEMGAVWWYLPLQRQVGHSNIRKVSRRPRLEDAASSGGSDGGALTCVVGYRIPSSCQANSCRSKKKISGSFELQSWP